MHKLALAFAAVVGCTPPAQTDTQVAPVLVSQPAAPAPPPPPSRYEIVEAVTNSFTAGIVAETAKFDRNQRLCDTNVGKELARLRDMIDRLPSGSDSELLDALSQAILCLECTESSMNTCWKLPARIRALGGTPPRLTTASSKAVTGKTRGDVKDAFLRGFDSYVDVAVACSSGDGPVPRSVIDDVDGLGDLIEAMDPPDDDLREAVYEMQACLECGLHAMKYCDRSFDAVQRIKSLPKRG